MSLGDQFLDSAGGSMGGYGAWDLAATHPDWFAAAAVISGGGDGEQASA